MRKPILDAFNRLEKAVPGVTIWDPMQVLCPPGEICNSFADGRPLFFDADHVSGYGNQLLVPVFTAFVSDVSASYARSQASPAMRAESAY